MIAICIFCSREVNTRTPGAFERVTGWVNNSGAKGFRTDAHMGDWCHEACLNASKRGLLGQESLLGDVA